MKLMLKGLVLVSLLIAPAIFSGCASRTQYTLRRHAPYRYQYDYDTDTTVRVAPNGTASVNNAGD